MEQAKWLPVIVDALRWIKDAKQFEKQYRKDCTDYDGAMESYTNIILDCARNLDTASTMLRKWEDGNL